MSLAKIICKRIVKEKINEKYTIKHLVKFLSENNAPIFFKHKIWNNEQPFNTMFLEEE